MNEQKYAVEKKTLNKDNKCSSRPQFFYSCLVLQTMGLQNVVFAHNQFLFFELYVFDTS